MLCVAAVEFSSVTCLFAFLVTHFCDYLENFVYTVVSFNIQICKHYLHISCLQFKVNYKPWNHLSKLYNHSQ